MPLPAKFDGRRLRRQSWTIPFTLSFAPLIAYYAIVWVQPFLTYPEAIFEFGLGNLIYVIMDTGPGAPGVALFFALCGFGWGTRFASSAQAMLAKSHGVRELGPDAPLTKRVHAHAAALGLPLPKVAIMNATNAYAVGSSPKDAAVVIGLPLLQNLTSDELDAIIGHELGHIASGDMGRMQMAAGFQSMLDRITSAATDIGTNTARQHRQGLAAVFILLAGALLRCTIFLLSELCTKRISRSREFVADAFGAAVSSPKAMMDALRKVHGVAPAKPEFAQQHAYLMFWNKGGSLLATHPTLERRVAALEQGKHLQRLLSKGSGQDVAERKDFVLMAVRALWRGAGRTLPVHMVAARCRRSWAQATDFRQRRRCSGVRRRSSGRSGQRRDGSEHAARDTSVVREDLGGRHGQGSCWPLSH